MKKTIYFLMAASCSAWAISAEDEASIQEIIQTYEDNKDAEFKGRDGRELQWIMENLKKTWNSLMGIPNIREDKFFQVFSFNPGLNLKKIVQSLSHHHIQDGVFRDIRNITLCVSKYDKYFENIKPSKDRTCEVEEVLALFNDKKDCSEILKNKIRDFEGLFKNSFSLTAHCHERLRSLKKMLLEDNASKEKDETKIMGAMGSLLTEGNLYLESFKKGALSQKRSHFSPREKEKAKKLEAILALETPLGKEIFRDTPFAEKIMDQKEQVKRLFTTIRKEGIDTVRARVSKTAAHFPDLKEQKEFVQKVLENLRVASEILEKELLAKELMKRNKFVKSICLCPEFVQEVIDQKENVQKLFTTIRKEGMDKVRLKVFKTAPQFPDLKEQKQFVETVLDHFQGASEILEKELLAKEILEAMPLVEHIWDESQLIFQRFGWHRSLTNLSCEIERFKLFTPQSDVQRVRWQEISGIVANLESKIKTLTHDLIERVSSYPQEVYENTYRVLPLERMVDACMDSCSHSLDTMGEDWKKEWQKAEDFVDGLRKSLKEEK